MTEVEEKEKRFAFGASQLARSAPRVPQRHQGSSSLFSLRPKRGDPGALYPARKRERDKREKACTPACKALLLLFFSVSSSSPGKKGGRSKASPPPRSSSAEGFLRSFSRLVGRERCLRWHISDDSCRGFEVQETGKRARRGGKGERMRVRVPSRWGHSCVAFKGERGKESTTFPRRHASPSALLAAASKARTSLVH